MELCARGTRERSWEGSTGLMPLNGDMDAFNVAGTELVAHGESAATLRPSQDRFMII